LLRQIIFLTQLVDGLRNFEGLLLVHRLNENVHVSVNGTFKDERRYEIIQALIVVVANSLFGIKLVEPYESIMHKVNERFDIVLHFFK
jgi:hypothetical protein